MELTITVFEFNDYREFIKSQIKARSDNWGLITKLSKAAKCQRSYLSKVLIGEANLTTSQLFGIARHWGLREDESEYLLLLLEIEKAGSEDYRQHLLRKLKALKDKHQDLSKRVKRDLVIENSKDLFYYSSWHWVAIHILTSIPEFQTTKSISERLAISLSQVEFALKQLEEAGFVAFREGKWKYAGRAQHISKKSAMVPMHHSNWRQRAVMDAQDPTSNGIHFTVVQSLSHMDYARIQELLLNTIEEIGKIANPSKEEELICFTCDLFRP